jgi:tetratricopeptide (TPR) repeat protein
MPASTPSAGGIAATSTGGMAPPAAVSSTAAAAPAAVPPPGAEQRFDAALQLLKSHQYAQATQAFETLTQEAPNLSGAWTNLGILEARAKKIEPAIDALTHATATNPANATAYLQLGIVEREAGRYAQAESAYLKALSIRSDYAKAHYNLAILYDRYLNRPQDALNQYRAYQQIVGGDDLKLQAWIKGLEARMAAATNPSPHGAPQ